MTLLFALIALLLLSAPIQALSIYLAGKMCGLQRLSYRGSLRVMCPVLAAELAVLFGATWAPKLFHQPQAIGTAFLAVFLVSAVSFQLVTDARLLRVVFATMLFLVLVLAWTLVCGLCATPIFLKSYEVASSSSAPTLLGNHLDVECEHCGRVSQFAPPMRRAEEREPEIPGKETPCPNCKHEIPLATHRKRDGDKIYVSAWLQPRRWEFIAHRRPGDPDTEEVHRLVGLPGEAVEVLDGDVFVNERRVPKSPDTAQELWILVHDTSNLTVPSPAWRSTSGSSRKEPSGVWVLHSREGGSASLEFTRPITDAISYNDLRRSMSPPDPDRQNVPVRDVRIRCEVAALSGPGRIGLAWQHRGLLASAWISQAGEVELTTGNDVALGKLVDPISSAEIVFAVRDGHTYLTHGSQDILSLEVGPQALEEARKVSRTRTPCRLTIEADRCDAVFPRIIVEREVFYRKTPRVSRWPQSVSLKQDEIFVLGDNSPYSGDSRYWGPLPLEDLVGTVVGIYWPPRRWRLFR